MEKLLIGSQKKKLNKPTFFVYIYIFACICFCQAWISWIFPVYLSSQISLEKAFCAFNFANKTKIYKVLENMYMRKLARIR